MYKTSLDSSGSITVSLLTVPVLLFLVGQNACCIFLFHIKGYMEAFYASSIEVKKGDLVTIGPRIYIHYTSNL